MRRGIREDVQNTLQLSKNNSNNNSNNSNNNDNSNHSNNCKALKRSLRSISFNQTCWKSTIQTLEKGLKYVQS